MPRITIVPIDSDLGSRAKASVVHLPVDTEVTGADRATGTYLLLLGHDDVLVVRLEFFVLAVLSVGAVHLLALALWRSVIGALVAATVFASFQAYAQNVARTTLIRVALRQMTIECHSAGRNRSLAPPVKISR